MRSKKTFALFRKIAKTEGISFLLLLFVAMPLKYFAGFPLAVTIVGAIHGVLFIAFCIWLFLVHVEYKKKISWSLKAFLASIIPFGTIYLDRYWRKEMTSDLHQDISTV